MAELKIIGAKKEYDLHTLGVKEFTHEFADGSLTTIVGMLGSGKSTLVNLICGIVDVTAGQIFLGGKELQSLEPKFRNVCLMKEGMCATKGSVRDNLSYGLKLRGFAKAEIDERVNEALALLGLEQVSKEKMKNLSELERRLTSLGRAVVRKPDLFILDEPFFNVSDEDKQSLAQAIRSVQKATGITTLLISSEGADAFLCGDYAIIMREGEIIQKGSERELLSAPADMFVASYIGENPMSFIREEECFVGFRADDVKSGEKYVGVIEGEENGYLTLRIREGEPPVRVKGKGEAGEKFAFDLTTFIRFDQENGKLIKNL